MPKRQVLTIDELRDKANRMGAERGHDDGLCTDLRFTPTQHAEGVRNDLGANWTVMVLGCTPLCVDFWRAILEDLAKEYDVAF